MKSCWHAKMCTWTHVPLLFYKGIVIFFRSISRALPVRKYEILAQLQSSINSIFLPFVCYNGCSFLTRSVNLHLYFEYLFPWALTCLYHAPYPLYLLLYLFIFCWDHQQIALQHVETSIPKLTASCNVTRWLINGEDKSQTDVLKYSFAVLLFLIKHLVSPLLEMLEKLC